MERTIERKQLKKNFLNEIIMRLDFQGVLQAEMDITILFMPLCVNMDYKILLLKFY